MTKFTEGALYTTGDEFYFKIIKFHDIDNIEIEWNNGVLRVISLSGFEHLWKLLEPN